jgi:hypothetical protein
MKASRVKFLLSNRGMLEEVDRLRLVCDHYNWTPRIIDGFGKTCCACGHYEPYAHKSGLEMDPLGRQPRQNQLRSGSASAASSV